VALSTTPFPASAGRYAYARLPQGIPEADVITRATSIALEADPRFAARPNEIVAWPIAGVMDEHAGRAVPLFAAGVGLIFLALCANASGLLIARMAARRREFSVQLALGASRSRLLREHAVEHALLGGAGVVGGLMLAAAMATFAPPFLTEGFAVRESLNPVDVDPRAAAVAAALGFVAVLIAGVLPAWIGTRLSPAQGSRISDRTYTDSRSARVTTRALLVGQIAFAALLMVGASLLVRSFERMAHVDRGMNARGVRTISGFLSPAGRVAVDDLEARIAALPGVEDVTVGESAPPRGRGTSTTRWRTATVGDLEISLFHYEVRPDFFDFYGITLVKGRRLRAGDPPNAVVVGERLAAMLWPAGEAIGQTMTSDEDRLQLEVIGIAKEITLPSVFEGTDLPEMYTPYAGRSSVVNVSWRCNAECPDRRQVVARVREVDPAAEMLSISVTEDRFASQLVRPRAAAQLGAAFALVALLTSGAGLFAALGYSVARRRREFGIRAALGASPANLGRGVVSDALRLAALGVAIGGAGAWALQRALEAIAYGISHRDPLAWLAMLTAIVAVTLAASWRPARQAARVDPVQLLREE
jgi:predicted permease